LNKFAIVPEHFILATKSFKEQTHLLDPEDLSAALACLNVWQANGQELFGFFNSGEHSGASQPHRHLQFLPVESMMLGVPNGAWKPLVDDLVSSSELGMISRPTRGKISHKLNIDLPFTFFKTPIPQSATPKQLHELYLSLHEQACVAVNAYLNTKSGTVPNLQSSKSGSSPISYNLGLTHKSMVLCPRRAEGMLLEGDHEVKVKSSMVALNGTMLGGTLLVKSDFEWDLLRKDESRLKMVLEACGFPSPTQGETTTGRL
jgi:ATP adenylyltransferase